MATVAVVQLLVVRPLQPMGWDAYVIRPEFDPRTSDDEFLTPTLQEHFRRASHELAGIVGSGSDNLGTGTLGCLSNGIITRAKGISDYYEASNDGGLLWSPEVVRRAHERTHWDFQLADDEYSLLVTEARLADRNNSELISDR